MTSRGPSRRAAIWVLLLLGGATLAVSAVTWSTTTGATALEPVVDVAVSGTTAAPGVGAAALVLVAAALALGLVGRVGRWVVLAVAAASGVVTTASALGVALDPETSARSAVADATGVTELTAPVTLTPAPWAAVVLGVLTVLVVAGVAVAARGWTSASTRHERDASAAPAAASAGASGDEGPGAATQDAALSDHDAWDALSRGEDPTDTSR
ncbi:Trp biosynthesis-associated membrane protein [Cellulosimicrobium marinum]|uniref:Trp biosynthesis-associated membrane protein n=1 Tax=Cellulosimicrobium marinum TaxID=1638992 RepID=UPI001E5EE85C|nr:Trp biosynthesis-associated membrane protein [Cellulosimicrobium marinum]MCB7137365.1 Trp biosynthesis-associated membrane protein [Cellulosimicrobium marinum]